jgi:hypothetical protein
MTDPDNIAEDFRRIAERYASGELLLLIDGSGSMPAAFNGKANPVSIAAGYGVEAKAGLKTKVNALFFGEPNSAGVPIELDGTEDPMRRFPGGPGYLLPVLKRISEELAGGAIRQPLHLVIVSDGEISEPLDEAREEFIAFRRKHPQVMMDILVPARHRSEFAEMIRALPDDGNAPRVAVVDSAENLKHAIADAINSRSGGKQAIALLAKEAVEGVSQKVTLMQTFRLRKPESA